ncbi:hypothetical protein QM467_01595 [Rhodoblastus sp. 17X3]|uniref:hypothetical protein n=1 Tax=Rhodoblastus sp. 17X3 TaxID=3047026 RepID=UPI0024B829E0|nr:hypothetical protein [Rhodoblastus sp. 17X3]MDI9846747.1 hypothetical protein [Rhodoblastus sp. 17X3]
MRKSDGFTHILEFTPAVQVLIEDAIEALILLLDEIDGDADLEENLDQEDIDEREHDPADDGIADGDAVAEYFCRVEANEQPIHLPGGNGDCRP